MHQNTFDGRASLGFLAAMGGLLLRGRRKGERRSLLIRGGMERQRKRIPQSQGEQNKHWPPANALE